MNKVIITGASEGLGLAVAKKFKADADMKDFVEVEDIAELLYRNATTPKNVQVGEIIINKKKRTQI